MHSDSSESEVDYNNNNNNNQHMEAYLISGLPVNHDKTLDTFSDDDIVIIEPNQLISDQIHQRFEDVFRPDNKRLSLSNVG
eukprot:Pgem_evm1s19835